jgi:hypothetical protein
VQPQHRVHGHALKIGKVSLDQAYPHLRVDCRRCCFNGGKCRADVGLRHAIIFNNQHADAVGLTERIIRNPLQTNRQTNPRQATASSKGFFPNRFHRRQRNSLDGLQLAASVEHVIFNGGEQGWDLHREETEPFPIAATAEGNQHICKLAHLEKAYVPI